MASWAVMDPTTHTISVSGLIISPSSIRARVGDHLRFVLNKNAGHLSSVSVSSGRTSAVAPRVQRIFEFAFQSTVNCLCLKQDQTLCVDGPVEWESPPLDAPGVLRFYETYYGCKTMSGTVTVEAQESTNSTPQCADSLENSKASLSTSNSAAGSARRRKKRAKKKEKARAAKASTTSFEAAENDGIDEEEPDEPKTRWADDQTRYHSQTPMQRSPSLYGAPSDPVVPRTVSPNSSAETHLLLSEVAAAQLQRFGDSPTTSTRDKNCSSSSSEGQKSLERAGVGQKEYIAHATRQRSKQLAETNATIEHDAKVRRFFQQMTPSVLHPASDDVIFAKDCGSAPTLGQTSPLSRSPAVGTTKDNMKPSSPSNNNNNSCSCLNPFGGNCDRCSADGRIAWQRQRQREKAKIAAAHQRALDARVQSYTQPQKRAAVQQPGHALSSKSEVPVVVIQQGRFEPPMLRLQEGEHAIFMVDSSVVGCVRLAVTHLGLESPTLMPGESWTLLVPLGAVSPLSSEVLLSLTSLQSSPALRSVPLSGALDVERGSPFEETFKSRGNVVDQVFLGTCELTVVHFHCNYSSPSSTATEQPLVQSSNEYSELATGDDDDSFDPSDKSDQGVGQGPSNRRYPEPILGQPGSDVGDGYPIDGSEYYSSESSSFYDSDDLLSDDDNDEPPLAVTSCTTSTSALREVPPAATRSVSWALAPPSPLPPSSPLIGSFSTLGATSKPGSSKYCSHDYNHVRGEKDEGADDATMLSPVRASEVAQAAAAAAANFYQPSWEDQEVDLSKHRRIPQLPFMSHTPSAKPDDTVISYRSNMGVAGSSDKEKSGRHFSSSQRRISSSAVKNRRRTDRGPSSDSHGQDRAESSASSSSFSSSSRESGSEFHGRLVYGNSVGPMLPSALDVSPLTSPDDTPRQSPAPSPSRASAHYVRSRDNLVRGASTKSRSSNSSGNGSSPSNSSHRKDATMSCFLLQPARPVYPMLKTPTNAEATTANHAAASESDDLAATANSADDAGFEAAPLRSLRRRSNDLRERSKRTVQVYVDSADEVDSDDYSSYSSVGVRSSSSSTTNTPSAATAAARTAASSEIIEAQVGSAEAAAGEEEAARMATIPPIDKELPAQLLGSPPQPSQLLGSFWSPTEQNLEANVESVDESVSVMQSSQAEFAVLEAITADGARVLTDFAAEALAIAQAEASKAMITVESAEEASWTTVSSKPRKQRRNRTFDPPKKSSKSTVAFQEEGIRSNVPVGAVVPAPSRRAPDTAPAKSVPSPPGPQPRAEIIRAALPRATLAEIPSVAATAPLEPELEPKAKKKKRKKKRVKEGTINEPGEKITDTTLSEHKTYEDYGIDTSTMSTLNLEDASNGAVPSLSRQIESTANASSIHKSTHTELDSKSKDDIEDRDDDVAVENFVIRFGGEDSNEEVLNVETAVATEQHSAPLNATSAVDLEKPLNGENAERANSRRVLLDILHGTTPPKPSRSSKNDAGGISGALEGVNAEPATLKANIAEKLCAAMKEVVEIKEGHDDVSGDVSVTTQQSEPEESDPWANQQTQPGVEERRYDPQDGGGPFARAEFEAFYGHALVWDAATLYRLPWFSMPPTAPSSSTTQLASDNSLLKEPERIDSASHSPHLEPTELSLRAEDFEDSQPEPTTHLQPAMAAPTDSLVTIAPASTPESVCPSQEELAALEADTYDYFVAKYATIVALVKDSGVASSARDACPGGKRVPIDIMGQCSGLSPQAPPFPSLAPSDNSSSSSASTSLKKTMKSRLRHHKKPQSPDQETRNPKSRSKHSRSRK